MWAKTGEICRAFTAAVLAFGLVLLWWWKRFVRRAGHREPVLLFLYMAAIDSSCFSSLFWAVSICLCAVKAGEACHLPFLLFQQRGLFLAGEFLLVFSSAGLGDGMMQAKWSCLPSFVCMVILRFCCLTVLLKFCKRSPRTVFVHG